MNNIQWLKITQTRSGIGRPRQHRRILKSLGLGRPGYTVIRPATPNILGMIRKIPHLLSVEPVSEPPQERRGKDDTSA